MIQTKCSAVLKMKIDFAYKTATQEAGRQGQKTYNSYSLRSRKSNLILGVRVLVRNIWLKCNKRVKDVYLVVAQQNPKIHGNYVKREDGKALEDSAQESSAPIYGPLIIKHAFLDAGSVINDSQPD